jgi:hypothetical protein
MKFFNFSWQLGKCTITLEGVALLEEGAALAFPFLLQSLDFTGPQPLSLYDLS